MKKVYIALALLIVCLPLSAQLSYKTVTATITDPNSNPYANAGYSISLVDSHGLPVSSASTPNGQLFNAQTVSGILDATGHFSATLVPNNILTKPNGTQWKFTITPPADSAILLYQTAWSVNYQTAITADVDLSTQLSAQTKVVAFVNLKTGQSTISGNDATARAAAAAAQSTANTANSAASTANTNATAAQSTANTANTTATGAQSTATAAQTTANAALPANGATSTGSGSSNVLAFPGSVTGQTLGGTRQAAQWQTGGGNNGIANAAAGATNGLVIADPSYANNERSFTTTYFTAPIFHYKDLRLGGQIDYYHNPYAGTSGSYNQFDWHVYGAGGHTGESKFCLFDVFNNAGGGGPGCLQAGVLVNGPGYSRGNPGGVAGTAAGWTSNGNMGAQTRVRSQGISESFGIWHEKFGVGDNYGQYTYVYGRNGTTAASDEGTGGIAALVQTQAPFTALCTARCSFLSTSIFTNGGAGVQGDGQYVIDTTATSGVISGHIVSVANGLGSGMQALTLDTTVTPSTAWGTINNTDLNNVPALVTSPFTTSETFSVTLTSGTFVPGALICFTGTFHEQAMPTAVGTASGGVQTVTAPLRQPHVGGYVFQGGECGKGLEDTSMTQGGSPHLFDVVGSTSANIIQVVKFQLGAASSAGFATPLTVSLTTATASSGTTVTGVVSSWTLYHPWNYAGASFLLSGSSDSALNTTCTNAQWSTQTAFTCTIAGLSGTHTTTTTMTALLAPGLLKLWPMAETVDVQNEALTPPQVDGTLTLEPNIITFATNDTILQTNSVTSRFQGIKGSAISDNPYGYIGGGAFSMAGHGAQGGGNGTTTNAVLNLGAGGAATDYAGWGGTMTPPNIANIGGYYAYGLNFGVGPSPEGVLLYAGVDGTQRTNPTYNYDIIQTLTNASAFRLNTTPATGALSMQAPGNLSITSVGGTNLGSYPVASQSALQITGNLFTGGSGSTTYPYFYINPSASSVPSDWNTNGTWLGIQTHGASSADFANWKNNSTTKFKVDSSGNITTMGTAAMATGSTMNGVGLATTANIPVTMVASGASHAGGLAPDPGSSAGTTRYLREDATWATPSGAAANTANIPAWLKNLGDSGGNTDNSCPSGTCVNYGDLWVRNFTVAAGAIETVTASSGLTVHATGTCTINGTIDARGITTAGLGNGVGVSGTGGGGGGGTAVGTAGGQVFFGPLSSQWQGAAAGGTAGGGNGTAGTTTSHAYNNSAFHIAVDGFMVAYDGQYISGASGGRGGSTGGVGGNPGTGVTLICASITGTGTIDVSGQYGSPAVGNSTGAGGGAGGGNIFLSSQAAVTYSINTYAAGGAGSLAGTVGYPEALWSSGTATTPAKATLGVTAGALDGTCTVQQAGAGYGTGTGTTAYILGGGGTAGTAVVNATWSGGALASCTVTPGTSSGYTATTYTTSGAGGDGGNGFIYTVSGW